MITEKILQEAIFKTIKKGSCHISPDVRRAFEKAIEKESFAVSKKALEGTLKSLDLSIERECLACPDTGWPLFFCKVGNDVRIEGGILALEEITRKMVAKATQEGYLRSTMKHPLTGVDPGTNVGMNIPGFTYQFVPGDALQITFVAKGGGSECFGGTRYRVVAFADGLVGIEKSIIDWYIAASRAGAICPPAILGVGIGGSADIATNLAKEAAALRIVGSRHPEPPFARIEEDLTAAINGLEIGTMGSGGKTSVFAVHVEYSLTHLAGIAVAMSANCMVARRATTRIHADGRMEMLDDPNWFNGR
jgi:tartrate/fumarate subfamily iron-sulfur-dependent hydro-lyase alpha chain